MTGEKFKHIGLFEGIGGFSIAAHWTGWETIAWCEINEFCQRVLSYHFPNAKKHTDIKTTDFSVYRGKCDIVTGGAPCQPYSCAGDRKGTADDRHLWPFMLGAFQQIQPKWVVFENVVGLTNWSEGVVFEQIQLDLEAAGYEVQSYVLPACAVNAPHRRDRVWIIAHASSDGQQPGRLGENRSAQGESAFERDQWERIWSDFRRVSKSEYITDTEFERLQESEESEEFEQLSDVERNNTQQFLSNPNGIGLRGKGYRNGKSKFNGEDSQEISGGNEGHVIADTNDKRSEQQSRDTEPTQQGQPGRSNFEKLDWSNFPTQSPVCWRDDGFPGRLDGLTFPKWRSESIKAFGNAVVPELVLMIFKAIEQYEHRIKGLSD